MISLGIADEVDVYVVFENGREELWGGKINRGELRYVRDTKGKYYFSDTTLKRAGVTIMNTVIRYTSTLDTLERINRIIEHRRLSDVSHTT